MVFQTLQMSLSHLSCQGTTATRESECQIFIEITVYLRLARQAAHICTDGGNCGNCGNWVPALNSQVVPSFQSGSLSKISLKSASSAWGAGALEQQTSGLKVFGLGFKAKDAETWSPNHSPSNLTLLNLFSSLNLLHSQDFQDFKDWDNPAHNCINWDSLHLRKRLETARGLHK